MPGYGSGVSAPTSDPVFLHVKSGMTVIVTDTDGAWRMADSPVYPEDHQEIISIIDVGRSEDVSF